MVRRVDRTVTLVLVDHDGRLLGALAPYPVPEPWWQDITAVVAGARERYGLDATVLRLLAGDRPAPPGGHVTYLASVAGTPPPGLTPVDVELGPQPHRAPYAELGGPEKSVAWAVEALATAGREVTSVQQRRTWNLSALWRLETRASTAASAGAGGAATAGGADRAGAAGVASGAGGAGAKGAVWLKQVPAFFRHEAAVLSWLADAVPGFTPVPLAWTYVDSVPGHGSAGDSAAHRGGTAGAGGCRMVLDEIPGTDRYEAGPAERVALLADLHVIQLAAVGRTDELLALGVPDRRTPELAKLIRGVVARSGGPELDGVLAGLDERLAAIDACGLPDTLVHGDFHAGNACGREDWRQIIDWGDSVVGNPVIDLFTMTMRSPNADELRAGWCRQWRDAVPGCAPERAIELIEPVIALRNAAVYAGFLDAIEPTEWPYHADDVPHWLAQAAGTPHAEAASPSA